MYLISTLKFYSSSTQVIQSLVVKNFTNHPLINLLGIYSLAPGVFLQKQRLFQNQRWAFPLNVSVNCSRTGFRPRMQRFSFPSTSNFSRLSNFTYSFCQSQRMPAIWTLTIPQPPPARVQSKYFLQVFITSAVENMVSNKPVVVKLHSNFSTTPSTVFFLISLIIPCMKGTQSCKFLSVCTTSSFLPSCITKAVLSSQALSSTYLVNHNMIIIHIQSGFNFRSPCSMQALQKEVKNPLSESLLKGAFSMQVQMRVVYFSFQRSIPLPFPQLLLAYFLSSFWMGMVLQPLQTSLNYVCLGCSFFFQASLAQTSSRNDMCRLNKMQ